MTVAYQLTEAGTQLSRATIERRPLGPLVVGLLSDVYGALGDVSIRYALLSSLLFCAAGAFGLPEPASPMPGQCSPRGMLDLILPGNFAMVLCPANELVTSYERACGRTRGLLAAAQPLRAGRHVAG